MIDTLKQHHGIWETKPVLRAVYADCYQRIVSWCRPEGLTLEIGGGTGNLKAYLPQIVSTDIQFAPWLDVVADAHRLPFAEGSFNNIVLFDVLHHLERPRLFLAEVARVLRPGGRLVMVEPGISPASWLFYTLLHPEPVRLREDPLAEGGLSPHRDPYDANQAIPTRLLGGERSRLEHAFPQLKVIEYRRFSLFAYPLSGGFRPWSALPARWVQPLLRLERFLEPALSWLLAFRLLGVIERIDDGRSPGYDR